MATPLGAQSSLKSPVRHTPGAYPSNPSDADAPTIVSTQLSLSQAVYQRRSEFTRSYTTKVKVGTWNVASLNGTEKDIRGWFVEGKGLSESLNGLAIRQGDGSLGNTRDRRSTTASVESSASQEDRRTKKRRRFPRMTQLGCLLVKRLDCMSLACRRLST